MEWRERDGVRWLEALLPGARAAFTTRLGGVSEPPFASLNIGLLTGDQRQAVAENRRRTAAAIGVGAERVLIGRQVHGTEIEVRDRAPDPNGFADPGSVEPSEVDGQVTPSADLAPLVFVADCLPVALVGPGGIAMLHCGWRGLAGGIVDRGARQVGATAAAIGPGIGSCCYEVGEEVLNVFRPLGAGLAKGPRLDLAEVARRSLDEAGVNEVEVAGICTSCERELFFSHRRDRGLTGRQAGIVWSDDG